MVTKLIDEEVSTHHLMMEQGVGIPVQIRDEYVEKVSSGMIRVQFWSPKERMKRAFKFGGLCWVFALVSVALPLLHFVLVPLFFLSGPLVAILVYDQQSVVLGGEGTCPNCDALLLILQSRHRYPIYEICISCQRNLKIEPVLNPQTLTKS